MNMMRIIMCCILAFVCLRIWAAPPKDKQIFYQGTHKGTYNFFVNGRRVAYTKRDNGDSVHLYVTKTKGIRHDALVLTITPQTIQPVDLTTLHQAINFKWYTEERFIHVMQLTPNDAIIHQRAVLPNMEPNPPHWVGEISTHTIKVTRVGGLPGIEVHHAPFNPGDLIDYEANLEGGYTFKLGNRTLLYTEGVKGKKGQVLFRPTRVGNILIGHFLKSDDGDGMYLMLGSESTDALLDVIQPILAR